MTSARRRTASSDSGSAPLMRARKRPPGPNGDSMNVASMLAYHDVEIETLSRRLGGVEDGLKTLHSELDNGFSGLNTSILGLVSKVDKVDARPVVELHKIVSVVLQIAILFSMVVAMIIWIATAQFSGYFETGKETKSRLDRLENRLQLSAPHQGN